MGLVASTVVAGMLAGVAVALLGLVVLGHFVQRSRARAEARLDDMSARVLQLAAALSAQTRAEGYEARTRLIRAAHVAMAEQAARSGRRS